MISAHLRGELFSAEGFLNGDLLSFSLPYGRIIFQFEKSNYKEKNFFKIFSKSWNLGQETEKKSKSRGLKQEVKFFFFGKF